MRRIGIELELLAPSGGSRRRLADEIAAAAGGKVTMSWHIDSERSARRDGAATRHITPAFDIAGADGAPLVRIVDDVTIIADLNKQGPPVRYWRRVLSEDARVLRTLRPLLAPLGDRWDGVQNAADQLGLEVHETEDGIRLHDSSGASVAVVGEVGGERVRVAECISRPLAHGSHAWFDLVAGTASRLGFLLPKEGATHLHHDAAPFRSLLPFQRLVRAFGGDTEPIRARFNTNLNCRGIGPLDQQLVDLVNAADYQSLTWDRVAAKCQATGALTKYCDVNLQHLLAEKPRIETVEFRMLPTTLDADQFADMVAGVEELVERFLAPVD